MKKTLVTILNHNLLHYTDCLYGSLKPYESQGNYDLIVIDNGSSLEQCSKYTKIQSRENAYFGGGLQCAVQYVLETDNYDSLLFLNNDLTLCGNNFVKTLRDEMLSGNYGIVSPCFLNIDPEPDRQCYWKTMRPHYTGKTRKVPFVDLQGPMIRRDVLEKYATYKTMPDLMIGFGCDALLSIICNTSSISMGVLDQVCMVHHNSLTVRSGATKMTMQEYCSRAEDGQRRFFANNNLIEQFNHVRALGSNYSL